MDKINTATSRETGAKKPEDPKNLGLGMNNHLTQEKDDKEAKIEKKGGEEFDIAKVEEQFAE